MRMKISWVFLKQLPEAVSSNFCIYQRKVNCGLCSYGSSKENYKVIKFDTVVGYVGINRPWNDMLAIYG